MTKLPTQKELNLIQKELAELSAKRTKHQRWHIFFEDCPYALSSSLSLSASDELILLTNERDPDMILYSHRGDGPPRFGILEIGWQRDHSASSRTLRLLPEIEVALDSCRQFVTQGKATLRHANRNVLCIGNESNLLVITGMDEPTCDALDEEFAGSRPLPEGMERPFYPSIAKLLAFKVPPQIVILSPCVATGAGDTFSVLGKLRMDFDRKNWEASRCG